jgi:hypothetical protein
MSYRPKQAGPLSPDPIQAALVASGRPIHVIHSPKIASEPESAAAWCDAWGPHWWPWVRVALWNEPADDFGGAGQPPIDVWIAAVHALADVCDSYGIRSMAHMETWSLSDNNPHRDEDTARTKAMLDGVKDRLSAVGWSYFCDAKKDRAAMLIGNCAAFMSQYDLEWGLTAIGIYVPYGMSQDAPEREDRVKMLHLVYEELRRTEASLAGYYALPQGPDRSRDFYDDKVSTLLPAEHKVFSDG